MPFYICGIFAYSNARLHDSSWGNRAGGNDKDIERQRQREFLATSRSTAYFWIVLNLVVVAAYMAVKYEFGQESVLIYGITIFIFFPLIPQMTGSVLYMLSELFKCCSSFNASQEAREEREWKPQGQSYVDFQSRRFKSFKTPQAPLNIRQQQAGGGAGAGYTPPAAPSMPSRSDKPANADDGGMGEAAAQQQRLLDAQLQAGAYAMGGGGGHGGEAAEYARKAEAARDMYTSRDEEAYHQDSSATSEGAKLNAPVKRGKGGWGFGRKKGGAAAAGKAQQVLGTSNVAKYDVGKRVSGLGKRHDLAGTVVEVTPTFPGAVNGPGTITIAIDGPAVV